MCPVSQGSKLIRGAARAETASATKMTTAPAAEAMMAAADVG
jgi:hypothetical protein